MNRVLSPDRSLEAAFRSGRPVVTCEIAAGDGADPQDVTRRARLVRDHVDAVNVPDNTAGVAHLAAWAAAILVAREGIDPILHVTCRDRNRLALQSDLLGAGTLGVRNILCLTGDHMVHGDHPDAKPVFDLDSLHLIASLTYGSLLGTYILGGAWPRARQVDVIIALIISIIVMSPIVLGAVIPHFPLHWLPGLAWPWYVPLGTLITVLVGILASLVGRSDGLTVGRNANSE